MTALRLVWANTIPAEGLEDVANVGTALHDLFVRGQADGTIDPGLPEEWFGSAIGGNLMIAIEILKMGLRSRHETMTAFLRAVEKAVRA